MRKNAKEILRASFAVFSLFAIVVSASAEEKKSGEAPKKVATVNGVVITESEVDREVVNLSRGRAGQMQENSTPDDLRDKALESIINRQVLYEAGLKAGIKIEDAAVDENWNRMTAGFPSKEALDSVLERENVTVDTLKAEIKEGLTIQKYIEDEFVSKTKVSSEQVEEYYDSNPQFFKRPEMVHASHILIKVDPKADDAQKAEARKKIEEVEKKVKAGEDFATLAETYSEGPSKTKGGDLGFFRRGQMVKPFEDVAFSLGPGEVGPIVETRFGYHIVKVFEKQPEGVVPLEEVGPRIEQVLIRQQVQKEVEKRLESLKQTARIERFETDSGPKTKAQ